MGLWIKTHKATESENEIRERKGKLSGKFISFPPLAFMIVTHSFLSGGFWKEKGTFFTLRKAKGGFAVKNANFPLSRFLIPWPYAS